MCDWFGHSCFEDFMINEGNYKSCLDSCKPDCEGTSYSIFYSLSPIDTNRICKKGFFNDVLANKHNHWFYTDTFDFFTGKVVH